jgi:signal transduction histidine kinase
MKRLRDLSIGRKLLGASLVAALVALVAAAAAFVAYDLHTFRRLLVQRIETDTRIVAFNTVSAVVFDDAEAASATLAALQAEPQVESAGVYTPDGRLFAAYARAGASAAAAPLLSTAGHRFTSRHLVVAHPIDFEERRIGMVVIQADLSEIEERAWHYAGIVLAVLVGSLLAATAVSGRLQGAIARPIVDLAETASRVSRESDYSIRARAHGADELGALVDSFNGMLVHIQAQDAQLREARDTLEGRVAERTRELEARSQELSTANKELEAFSYSVSHDLRAPLRAIDGFSKALLTQYSGQVLDAQGNHYLQRVRAATQRMSQLIDDLLHLARVTRAGLARREIDLTRVARGIAAELERQHPERRVEVAIEDGLTARADPHLVGIVLQNLLGNAWKFTGRNPGGRIEVGAQGQDGSRVLYVRDNGAGFDMAYADKLFGVFQRLHTEAEFEGTGIGLATVHRIMLRHGGRIWAEAALGQGATFFFTFQGEHDRQDHPAR